MTDSLMNKLEILKSLISSDERVKTLNALDEEISNSEEVMKLSYKMDMASVNYADTLKYFKEDSKEVSDSQNILYLAKQELDNHPLVMRYNKAYREVKDLYRYINKELFGDFAL